MLAVEYIIVACFVIGFIAVWRDDDEHS